MKKRNSNLELRDYKDCDTFVKLFRICLQNGLRTFITNERIERELETMKVITHHRLSRVLHDDASNEKVIEACMEILGFVVSRSMVNGKVVQTPKETICEFDEIMDNEFINGILTVGEKLHLEYLRKSYKQVSDRMMKKVNNLG